jgi:hypothetical protein
LLSGKYFIEKLTQIMKLFKILSMIFVLLAVEFQVFAKPTEARLIEMLQSGNFEKMNDALDRLPNMYPNSTNAIEIIKGILRSNEVITVTRISVVANQDHSIQLRPVPVPHILVARAAARALGNYHATLNNEELAVIYNRMLHSRDENDTMDGLKALRGLNNSECVPVILPLLEDANTHVVRDTIRT